MVTGFLFVNVLNTYAPSIVVAVGVVTGGVLSVGVATFRVIFCVLLVIVFPVMSVIVTL